MERETSLDESEFVPVKVDFFAINSSENGELECRFDVQEGCTPSQVKISAYGVSNVFQSAPADISFDKLTVLHQRLMELFPTTIKKEDLPSLPRSPSGIWRYIGWSKISIPEGLNLNLAKYFENISRICGLQIVLGLFMEDGLPSEVDYEEKWSEMHRKHYSDKKDKALKEYEDILASKSDRIFVSIEQLHDYYVEEDEAEFFLKKAENLYYIYQSKPFEDLCEIALSRRNEAAQRVSLNRDEQVQLTTAREEKLYHEEYMEAKEKVDELLLERYQREAERAELKLRRMEEDRDNLGEHFDKKAWGRLEAIKDEENRSIVRYLEGKLEFLAGQRELALVAMAKIEEGPNMETEILECEDRVYNIHIKYLDVQLRLFKEEEVKLQFQLQYLDDLQKKKTFEEKILKLRRRSAKYRSIKRDLEDKCKHSMKKGPADINIEGSYAAPMAAKIKESFMKKKQAAQKQEMRMSRQMAVQRVKQYKQTSTPKKPVPKDYVPPWKRPMTKPANTSKGKEGAKGKVPSSASRVAEVNVKSSIKPRKQPSSGNVSSHSTHLPSDQTLRPDQTLMPDLMKLLSSLAVQMQPSAHGSPSLLPHPTQPPPLPPSAPPLPPPPAPPPPPPAVSPPAQPVKVTMAQKKNNVKEPSMPAEPGLGTITPMDIMAIRRKLKKSDMGSQIRDEEQTLTTAEEVKLIRMGGDLDRLSLTGSDTHKALKRKVQQVRAQVAPTNDDDDDDDYDYEEWK